MAIIKQGSVPGGADFILELPESRPLRILHLTDLQLIDLSAVRNPVRDEQIRACYFGDRRMTPEEKCLSSARKLITDTAPDLIALTGDNVYGELDDGGRMLELLIDFMESFSIPWAPVFGNHDNESAKGVCWQCARYEQAPHCVFSRGTVTGNGNYSLLVTAHGKPQQLLFFFDSNGCQDLSPDGAPGEGLLKSNPDYGQIVQTAEIYPDQIEWYRQTAGQENRRAGKVLPELFFLHMAPQLFRAAMSEKYQISPAAATAELTLPEDWGYLDEADFDTVDSDGTLCRAAKPLGLKGIFVGHWHNNAARIIYDDMALVFGLKAGWYSYEPKPRHVGGNLITFSSDGQLPAVEFFITD